MHLTRPILICSLFLAPLVGCRDNSQSQPASATADGDAAKKTPAQQPERVQPAAAQEQTPTPPQPERNLPDPLRGKVQETVDAGGYTYIRLATEQGDVWAAARKLAVAVGDDVELAGMMTMRDFRSPTLNRTFEEIQFAARAQVVSTGAAADLVPPRPGATTRAVPPGHPPIGTSAAPANSGSTAPPELGEIEKLPDGLTVAELFAQKADLHGKLVRFRGRVIKVNRGILGRNWLHIRDGTGEPGSNDITVTSEAGFAPPGSIVIVEGTLDIDKDFGAGYVYDVIVEQATVTIEPP